MEIKEKDGNANANKSIIKSVTTAELPKEGSAGEVEEDDETEALLPSRKGGLSKNSPKVQRKVQWNDSTGNKLVEVLEYQPRIKIQKAYIMESVVCYACTIILGGCVQDMVQFLKLGSSWQQSEDLGRWDTFTANCWTFLDFCIPYHD